MRHRKRQAKLGRTPAHRKAMFANMASSLITEGKIQTTLAKAKELRRVVEKLITLGKKGTLHTRRLAISRMRQLDAVAELFDTVAPKYADRKGGYTRIMKLGQRIGDGAQTCIIELVEADASYEAPVTEETTEAVPAAE